MLYYTANISEIITDIHNNPELTNSYRLKFLGHVVSPQKTIIFFPKIITNYRDRCTLIAAKSSNAIADNICIIII